MSAQKAAVRRDCEELHGCSPEQRIQNVFTAWNNDALSGDHYSDPTDLLGDVMLCLLAAGVVDLPDGR